MNHIDAVATPDQNALNNAAWKFIDNAPRDSMSSALWNTLKAALWPAIQCYISATERAATQPAGEVIGWLYDWTHSSALGKPDESFTGFTAKREDAFRPTNTNQRAVCLAAPISEDTTKAACAIDALDGMGFTYGPDVGWVPARTPASVGSIGEEDEFTALVHSYAKTVPTGAAVMLPMKAERVHAWNALVAYIDQWSARTQLAAVEPAEVSAREAAKASLWDTCLDLAHGMQDMGGEYVMVQLRRPSGDYPSTAAEFQAAVELAAKDEA